MNNLLRAAAITLLSSFSFSSFSAGNAGQPSICTRSCWGARATTLNAFGYMSSVNRAIVHHTGNASNYNTGGLTDSKAIVRATQNYHMDANGWADIGYHFLIDKWGNIFEGLNGSLNTNYPRGAHDAWNANSLGFSCLGMFHTPNNQAFTSAMQESLCAVIAWRMPSAWRPYGWPGTSYGTCGNTIGYVDGHRRVNCTTTCPGDIIYNSYLTSDLNGGAIRNLINQKIIGSTPWDASFNGQSYPTVMNPGTQATMWIEYVNRGSQSWVAGGATPTRLATSSPRGSAGYLYTAGNWSSPDRASDVDFNTAAGAIGRFTFIGTAPSTPGYYVSFWELVTDGVSWFEGPGDDAWFGINVAHQGDYVRFQAEDFSSGIHAVNGTDYWDRSGGNNGGAYRSTDVDIKACLDAGGGHCVGWTEAGEWLRYYYNATAGDYTWTVRYSNGSGAVQQARITLDGAEVGRVDLFPTANYDTFAQASGKVTVGTSKLYSVGVDAVTGGVDFNWFDMQKTYLIVDNTSAGFACSANWTTSTADPDKYGLNNRARATASGTSDAAVFTYSVPSAGTYNIWAWWTSGANRASVAPYVISRSGGTTTINKDQRTGGGSWQWLGAFSLNGGTNTVKLSCWTTNGAYVIADAIAVAPQ